MSYMSWYSIRPLKSANSVKNINKKNIKQLSCRRNWSLPLGRYLSGLYIYTYTFILSLDLPLFIFNRLWGIWNKSYRLRDLIEHMDKSIGLINSFFLGDYSCCHLKKVSQPFLKPVDKWELFCLHFPSLSLSYSCTSTSRDMFLRYPST